MPLTLIFLIWKTWMVAVLQSLRTKYGSTQSKADLQELFVSFAASVWHSGGPCKTVFDSLPSLWDHSAAHFLPLQISKAFRDPHSVLGKEGLLLFT